MRPKLLLAGAAALLLLAGCGTPVRKSPRSARAASPSTLQRVRVTTTATSNVPTGKPAQFRAATGALQGLSLSDADFVTAQDGWVVGAYGAPGGQTPFAGGLVARTVDGGATWQVARLPGTVPTQVLFLNAQTGFAVAGHPSSSSQASGPFGLGAQNLVLRSGDGGRTWSAALAAQGTVTHITQGPSGAVWAAVSGTCTSSACTGEILAAQAAPGATWSTLWTAPGAVLAVRSQGQHAWALVGVPDGSGSQVQVYSSADGGQHWSELATLPTGQEMSYLSPASQVQAQLQFTSPQDGWATLFSLASCAMHGCDVSDVYRTTDGGRTWTKDNAPTIGCQVGTVLAAAGAQVAVVQSVNLGACQGPENTLFVSTDGGQAFHVAKHWQELGVRAVGFVPGGGAWAVGQALLLQAPDGAWHQSFPSLAPSGPIDFLTASVGFAGGDPIDPGAILETTDGGRSWQELASIHGMAVTAIDFATREDGYVNVQSAFAEGQSAAVLRTTDGGRTWTAAYQLPAGGGGATALRFFTAHAGLFLDLSGGCFASCRPAVGKTADGGATWQVSDLGTTQYFLESASILAPGTYIAASSGGNQAAVLVASKDSGKTWKRLATLPFQVGTLDVDFPTPQIGYLLAWAYNRPPAAQGGRFVLLATADGGRAWTVHDLPGLSFAPAVTFYFLDAQRGWLLDGTTLWMTADGGAHWMEVHAAVP